MPASLDFADPEVTLQLMDELVSKFGMTPDQFRRLHHLPTSTNLSIKGHQRYARNTLRRSGRFTGKAKNADTAKCLALCLEGLRANLSWDAAITRAVSGDPAPVGTSPNGASVAAPAADRSTSDAATSRILDRCAYTILHRDKFEEGLASQRLVFTENKSWTGAQRWFNEATASGKRLALVLADAARCRDLIGWGLVDELTVHDGTTRIVASELRVLRGRSQQELVVYSSKQAIAEGHIRPYVLCETPAFVLEDAEALADDARTSPPSAVAGDESVGRVDVESDPVAYELVQRRMRRHQSEFRDCLMRAYEGRCAISGTNVPAVLEAAHIEPHVERGDNSAANGLLLRSDLHALFDEGLLRIHPTMLTVHLDPSIMDASYACFDRRQLRARIDKIALSVVALEARWNASRQ